MNYLISEALLREIVNYLIKQPYANVAMLIQKLQQLQQEGQKPSEVKEKKVDKKE